MISTTIDLIDLLYYKGYTQEAYDMFVRDVIEITIEHFIAIQNEKEVQEKFKTHSCADFSIQRDTFYFLSKELTSEADKFLLEPNLQYIENASQFIDRMDFMSKYFACCIKYDLFANVSEKVEYSAADTLNM